MIRLVENFSQFPLAITMMLAKFHLPTSLLALNHIPNSMSELLEDDDLTAAMKKCPGWEHEKNHLCRTIEFEEFNDAIDFVNDLAEIAEEAQHHPVITIKYNRVLLKLTTLDVGGVTELDIEFAQRVNNLVD